MHLADYDGSLAQERDRRIRRDNIRAIAFAVAFVGAIGLVAFAAIATLNTFGN